MIDRLRNVPAWVWWLVAATVGGGVLFALTGSVGAAGTVVAIGGAAAADGAHRRARVAREEARAHKPAPAPPIADRPTVAADRWDSGPAGRD